MASNTFSSRWQINAFAPFYVFQQQQETRIANILKKFTISGDYIELSKLLKASGLCDTGGMAKDAITGGRVTVGGDVEYRKGCKIRQGQKVAFAGRIIEVN